MPPKYKYYYFDGRGRAESVRYLFKLAGVEFEDYRFSEEEWSKLKPTIPTMQVPMLEIDGKKIVQSKAILVYLARKYGFYGKDEMEGLCIDMVIDTADDVVPPFALVLSAPNDEERLKHTKNFQEVDIPLFYKRLTNLLELEHGGDYFVGNKLTAADVHFVARSEAADVYFPNSLAAFPKLKAVYDRVVANPIIAKWREERPVTPW